MRILYGVAGEGMGHATRSSVVIQHLLSRGHDVLVASSGRACELLKRITPNVLEIVGLRIAYDDGAMDLHRSVALNAQASPDMLVRNLQAYATVGRFAPEIVFVDFEPFASYYAVMNGLRCVSIDNMQVIPRCIHGPKIVRGDEEDRRAASAFITFVVPQAHPCIITSFFFPPLCLPEAATLVPPILRDAILRARVTDAGHVLVYQTATGDSRLLSTLHALPRQRFVVYGLQRDAVLGNCVLRNFSEQTFIDDLASARAVVTNGGYSLISEAVALGKPVYSVPVRRHFEQLTNARYLDALGYGMAADEFSARSLEVFLANMPSYAAKLAGMPRHDGNQGLYAVLDQVVGGSSVAT